MNLTTLSSENAIFQNYHIQDFKLKIIKFWLKNCSKIGRKLELFGPKMASKTLPKKNTRKITKKYPNLTPTWGPSSEVGGRGATRAGGIKGGS